MSAGSRRVSTSRSKAADSSSPRKAISLFSSAGIGELGLQAAGLDILLANELVPRRAALYSENFPSTRMIQGDIWEMKDVIVEEARELLQGEELFLLYATPPCQGMSSNGAGKLQAEIEAGRRGKEEPRNRLVIPTMEVVAALQPRFVLFENVPQMRNTLIRNERDQPELILDFIQRTLGPDYVGCGEVLSCEDFGVPQRRPRLLSIFTRDEGAIAYFRGNGGSFLHPSMRSAPITLREAIGDLPPLDAVEGRNAATWFHEQHRVPVMDPRKHWWVSHTPEGATAFNNRCVKEGCLSDSTPLHREELVDGKWTSVDTPIHCSACGSLLPRPSVRQKDGSLRPLRGFHSAYRRMKWDQPANTITQNFIYEASDNKIHPSQNRVLSVYEAMILQTIDRYDYRFTVAGQDVGVPQIAEAIGESVPPLLMEKIARQLEVLSAPEMGETLGSLVS